ncbi:glycosyltransferase [Streptomyces sp. NPDC059875]|uniref:glycosyltransferase family 4 protein n=1 Tax=unclassified Streptomyces TaxID=2593676 RepID=UPI00365B25FE
MSTVRGPVMVAVSGPDGAGRSSLVRRIAGLLRERGLAVATLHCYGCFLCRSFSSPPRVRDEEEKARRPDGPTRRGSWARRAHALLDAVRSRGLPDAGSGNATPRKRVVVSIYDDVGNPEHRGGGARVVEKVARRLSDDFDVTVVTAGRRGGTRERDGIRYVHLPVRWAGPRAGQLLFLTLLPFLARRLPHDAWLENFTPPFSTSFLPLFSRAPVTGIDQGRSAEALWRRYHIPLFLVERLGLRCYRHIVVTNEADASAVRRLTSRADVQVIANGVEQRQIDDARLGAGDYILFLGRIDIWIKGIDLLLDAYRRERPPMPLLLAGSGTQAEERKLAALLAAHPDSVRWVGFAGEGLERDLLRNCAFLVMPSRHETFGLVALEGMSYGKPILHFDLPALRWMSDGGDVTVPPFDVVALGHRMRMLATDEAARRTLGRQAGQAAQRYTWDEMTGRYLALAHRLVDAPAAGRRPRKDRRGAPWRTTL